MQRLRSRTGICGMCAQAGPASRAGTAGPPAGPKAARRDRSLSRAGEAGETPPGEQSGDSGSAAVLCRGFLSGVFGGRRRGKPQNAGRLVLVPPPQELPCKKADPHQAATHHQCNGTTCERNLVVGQCCEHSHSVHCVEKRIRRALGPCLQCRTRRDRGCSRSPADRSHDARTVRMVVPGKLCRSRPAEIAVEPPAGWSLYGGRLRWTKETLRDHAACTGTAAWPGRKRGAGRGTRARDRPGETVHNARDKTFSDNALGQTNRFGNVRDCS